MKRLSIFNSLRNRLFGLILLVMLPGIVVVFYHAAEEREHVIEYRREHAAAIIEHIVDYQQKLVEDTRVYLIKLAQHKVLQTPENPACSEYLADVLKLSSVYANLGVPKTDGELLCNASPLKAAINVADRGYFQRAIHNRTFAISEFQNDRAASLESLNFAYPVVADKGKVVGAVVAVVSLDWWNAQLAKVKLPDNAVAVISDTDGNVIANYPPNHDLLGHSSSLLSDVTGQRTGDQLVKGDDGVLRVILTAPLYVTSAGGTLSMSVGIPVGESIAVANQEFYLTLLLVSGLMAVTLLLAITGLNSSVLNPLSQLARATRSLSEGHLTSFSKVEGAGELVQLQNQFVDMAHKRLAAEQLAIARNEELNSIFDALPDIYFRLDNDGLIIDYRARESADLYLQPEQFLKKAIQDLLPAHVWETFRHHFTRLKQGEHYQVWEYSLEFPDGVKQFEARLCPLAGSTQTIMVVRNITEEKLAEESLQLSSIVYSSISEAVMVTDAQGHIIGVNPAFTTVTGYTFEEVKGQFPSILKSGHQSSEFYKAFWDQLNTTGQWQGEIYNRRKNGEIYPQWLTVNTVYDNRGNPQQRVAMFIDFTEKKNAEDLIWRQANLDSLTGLPNRKLLNDRIRQEMQHTDRSGLPTAILFLDLDLFKEVNDTLGHAYGDQLLAQAAVRISHCVRSVDTVARQGGDEFAIILSQVRNPHVVDSICEELLHSLAEPYQLEDETAYITSSIGITLYPDDAETEADLIKSADQAMYVAKEKGRNRFQYFTREMQRDANQRMSLISDLRLALTEHQFVLYYQPIVSLQDRSIRKAEALIRWQHPQRGLVLPGDFIAIAEETRLITGIGSWVLEEAAKTVQMLQSRYDSRFQVSVNVSPIQFDSLDSNISDWLEQLESMGLSGDSIVAEITEGMMMTSSAEVRAKMIAFKDAGVQVSLDDFGTGYSSLAYISEYDIDYLKIDQYFVRNLSLTSDAYTLCKAIIMMAHNLGIKVIAEGIETEQQEWLLQELGCDYGQGYLYSKPVSRGDFEQLLREQGGPAHSDN
ncbi:EAL domain-containing protein [Amphritea sp.]|uniref:EAL domain-containing protein n=1 Tax=Amphritea sp. TaxID=1872502 RepID=UPI003D109CCB